jgi:hypothetical protein
MGVRSREPCLRFIRMSRSSEVRWRETEKNIVSNSSVACSYEGEGNTTN